MKRKKVHSLIKSLFKKRLFQAIVIILLTEIIFFYPVFFKGEVLFSELILRYSPYQELKQPAEKNDSDLKSDQMDGFYPGTHLFLSNLKEDGLTTWENSLKLGIPRDTILNLYFPPDYLALFMHIATSQTIVLLAKFFIGALSMYLFLRKLAIRHFPSIFGAIIFMYSGFNMAWNWNYATTTSLMAPLILYFTTLILQRKYRYLPIMALSVGLLLLTGFVAGAGYVLYLAAGFTITILIDELLKYKKKKELNISLIKDTIKPYILLGVSVFIGISLSVFTLIPAMTYLDYINIGYRKTHNANYHLSTEDSLPQTIMAYYNGGPAVGKYIGQANFNETSSYIGIVAIFFLLTAIYFIIKKKNIKLFYFLAMFILSILVVYNIGPFLSIINKLPIFDSSANTRLLMWTSLCGSILAAFGLHSIIDAKSHFQKINVNKRKIFLIVFSLIIFLPATIIILNKLGTLVDTYESTNSVDAVLSTHKYFLYRYAIIFLSTLVFFFVFLLTTGYIFSKKFKASYFGMMIIVLTFAELFIYGRKVTALTPKELFYPITPGINYLMEHTDEESTLDRVIAIDGTFGTRGTEAYYDLAIPLSHGLYTKPEKAYIEGLFKDRDKAWATRTMPLTHPHNIKYDSPIFDFLNVKFLAFPHGQKLSAEDQKALNENFKVVFDEAGDLTVYENIEGNSLVHTSSPADVEIIGIYEMKEEFSIKTEKPNVLYTSEIKFPGWYAVIDGEKAEMIKVDDIWRGVEVPPGQHRVEFRYESQSTFKYGLVYSVVVSIVILLYYIYIFAVKSQRVRDKLGL